MKLKIFFLFYFFSLLFHSCATMDEYEKNQNIPKHEWFYNFVPSYSFKITDTASEYNLFVTIRHTDAYKYENIQLNIGSQAPGDTIRYQRLNLILGDDAKGWEGTGMDDIWDVRKSITNGPVQFHKPGVYTFTLEQIMRENPLKDIMSVGIRVEKVK